MAKIKPDMLEKLNSVNAKDIRKIIDMETAEAAKRIAGFNLDKDKQHSPEESFKVLRETLMNGVRIGYNSMLISMLEEEVEND